MLGRLATPPTCVFVQLAQPTSRYIVVRESAERPTLLAAGAFECEEPSRMVENLRSDLSQKGISPSRAVLLLSRSDLEMATLRVPPATDEELPGLVANLAQQQLADVAGDYATDFVVCPAASDDSSAVLSFTAPAQKVQDWQQQFRACNMKLIAATFGGMGAVNLLNQVSNHPARTSVVVTTTDQDTDLAVVEAGQPILFRTIPRATGAQHFVVEQLAGEIQRTLTLVGHPDDEETRVYLIGTVEEQQDAAEILSQRLSLSVSLVNPFDQLSGKTDVDQPSRFANLIGVACRFHRDSLRVDLLHPRKPAARPTLLSRFGFWAAVAASLVGLAGYLYSQQAADRRAELESQRAILQRLIKPVKQGERKRKLVEALDSWRANEISWLDELEWLSEKVPPANQATIGSLTMTATSPQRGQMDMSLIVSEPSVRMDLEQAIRDERHAIRSQRVLDASNPANSAWRFKTTISVKPLPSPLIIPAPEDHATARPEPDKPVESKSNAEVTDG